MTNGETGWGLLISGFGDDSHGGGLFVYDGARLEQVDRISTTGLAVADGHCARLLRTPDELAASGELLIYDDRGVALYRRIDGLGDAHDIAWNGYEYVVECSFSNTIFWLSRSGEIVRQWRAPGEPDSWHLNCLCIRDSTVFVSAFGRFHGHREWNQSDLGDTGFLMNLETGADRIRGLSHPHSPRFLDGAWIICNSRTRELLQFDDKTGICQHRLSLNGYTRGVAVSDDFIFVGESTRRSGSTSTETANVAIVCRHTWTIRDRVPVPCCL